MRVEAVGFEPVISAVAGVQAIQPVQPVSPVDADAVGHRDVYIPSGAHLDTDTPIPSSAYNADGLFVDDVRESGAISLRTESGESFSDVLARVIRANARDVENTMANMGISSADLMDGNKLTDLIETLNDMTDEYKIPGLVDIPGAVEEFYRSIGKDNMILKIDSMEELDDSANNE